MTKKNRRFAKIYAWCCVFFAELESRKLSIEFPERNMMEDADTRHYENFEKMYSCEKNSLMYIENSGGGCINFDRRCVIFDFNCLNDDHPSHYIMLYDIEENYSLKEFKARFLNNIKLFEFKMIDIDSWQDALLSVNLKYEDDKKE